MLPFRIHMEEARLIELKERIAQTRWAETIPRDDWSAGVPASYLREMADYWMNVFDWRREEEKANAYPQFITTIDGTPIHYLHIKSKTGSGIPLIITHGWPGSFFEFLKIIPLLTDSEAPSFDLVIPSIPGFGFSQMPGRGVTAGGVADLWVQLMRRIGYEKFIAQGGDFGAIVSSHLALKYPEALLGLHLNYIPFNYKPYPGSGVKLTKEEMEAQKRSATFFQSEGAYAQVQTTRPLTLSYGLNDSPVGCCAWLLQLFHSFSNREQPLDMLFTRDELLANVSLYWLTGTLYSSMLLYPESMKDPLAFGKDDFIHTPVGIAHYPFPENFPARKYVERGYNVTYWKDMPAGGHFAALEQPGLFAADLKEFAMVILNNTW